MKIDELKLDCEDIYNPSNYIKKKGVIIFEPKISMTIKLIRQMWAGMTKTERDSWKKVIDEDRRWKDES